MTGNALISTYNEKTEIVISWFSLQPYTIYFDSHFHCMSSSKSTRCSSPNLTLAFKTPLLSTPANSKLLYPISLVPPQSRPHFRTVLFQTTLTSTCRPPATFHSSRMARDYTPAHPQSNMERLIYTLIFLFSHLIWPRAYTRPRFSTRPGSGPFQLVGLSSWACCPSKYCDGQDCGCTGLRHGLRFPLALRIESYDWCPWIS